MGVVARPHVAIDAAGGVGGVQQRGFSVKAAYVTGDGVRLFQPRQHDRIAVAGRADLREFERRAGGFQSRADVPEHVTRIYRQLLGVARIAASG